MTSIGALLSLDCTSCPALSLRTESQLKKIYHWYDLRLRQLEQIVSPKVILLCESFPKERYIYDLQIPYKKPGLRDHLKSELYGSNYADEQFLANLISDKILIVDCAFCPLHQKENGKHILTNTKKRHAATHCLQRHSLPLLNQFPNTPIITIFPSNRGFLKRQLPDIAARIRAEFDFGNLSGLKVLLEKI